MHSRFCLFLCVKFRWTIVLLLLQLPLLPLSNSFSLGFLNLEYYASSLPDLYLDSLTHIRSISLPHSFFLLKCFHSYRFCQVVYSTYTHTLTFYLSLCTSIFQLCSHSLQSSFAHTDIAPAHLHALQNKLITSKLNTVSKLHSITELKLIVHSAFGRFYIFLASQRLL